MTQDEIIRMAWDAGFDTDAISLDIFMTCKLDKLERFAALVAEATLEKVLACYSPDDTANDWADKIKELK